MTTLRGHLRRESRLRASVRDGLQALTREHRAKIDASLRAKFDDSLDLDAALREVHPEASRWDYLVGHAGSRSVLGIEPHSARDAEIRSVIAKRRHALEQLREHLQEGCRVLRWYWVASGRNDFLQIETRRRRLDEHGITFVDRQLQRRHLPAAIEGGPRTRPPRR